LDALNGDLESRVALLETRLQSTDALLVDLASRFEALERKQ